MNVEEEEDEFDVNEPGAGDIAMNAIEGEDKFISGGNVPGAGSVEMNATEGEDEFIFGGNVPGAGVVDLSEGEDEEDDDVIVISSEDEDGEDDNDVHPLLNYMMNITPEWPEITHNSLEFYTNDIVRTVITAATSTQTSTTAATTST